MLKTHFADLIPDEQQQNPSDDNYDDNEDDNDGFLFKREINNKVIIFLKV